MMRKKNDLLAQYLMLISRELANYLSRRVGSAAQDLLAEIVLVAYQNAKQLEKKKYDQFTYWIYDVAWKKTREWYRKNNGERRRKKSDFGIEAMDADPFAIDLQKEQQKSIIGFLNQITVEEKHLYTQRYILEQTYQEISRKTGENADALLTRNRRFLEKFKQFLRAEEIL